MFTATSKEKSFFNGELKVTVEYTAEYDAVVLVYKNLIAEPKK